VHAADIQDCDGAPSVLASIRFLYPWLRYVFAEGGYTGDKVRRALKRMGEWTIERRATTPMGCRTHTRLAQLPLAKDFEATITSVVAWVLVAHIRILTRRLARP
jgi:hypothetical protein